jgi:hypothetical protein
MLYYDFPSLMTAVMMKLTRTGDLVMRSQERIFFGDKTKASGNVFTKSTRAHPVPGQSSTRPSTQLI